MRRPFGILIAAATMWVWCLAPHAYAQAAPTGQGAPAGEQQPAPPDGQPAATAGQQGASAGQEQPTATTGQDEQQAAQKITFTGDIVLWAFTVHPDKTADYERVLAKVKDALAKLGRQQQAAGWKVIKNSTPQTDGSVLYIHVLQPVVPDADYSPLQIVYEAFPDPQERFDFYELYRGAVKGAFFLIQAPIVADFSR